MRVLGDIQIEPQTTGGGRVLGDISEIAKEPIAPATALTQDATKAIKTGVSYLGKIGEQIKKDVEEGKTRTLQEMEKMNKGSLIDRQKALVRGSLRTIGAGARAVFEPITVPLVDLISMSADKISDLPSVQKIAMSDAVTKIASKAQNTSQTLKEISEANPELTQDIKDVSDIFLTLIGENVVKRGIQSSFETAGKAKQFFKDGDLFNIADKEADTILKTTKPAESSAEVAKTFEKYGIKAPVSAVTDIPAIRGAEAYLQGQAIFGGSKITKIVDEARSEIGKIADSLKKEVDPADLKSGDVSPSSVGQDLKLKGKQLEDVFKKTKDSLYSEAENLIKVPEGQAVLDETRKALTEMVADLRKSSVPTSKKEADFFEEILNSLSTAEKRNYQNIKQTRSDIGKLLERAKRGIPLENADVGRLSRLYGSLSNDLDSTILKYGSEEAQNALKSADAFYKAGKNKLNSFIGRTIHNSRSPELLVDKFVKPGDITTVKDLKSFIGDEEFSKISKLFMNNVVDSSTNSLTGKVNAQKLSGVVNKYGDEMLKEILGDRGLKDLKDFQKGAIVNDIIDSGMNSSGQVMPKQLANAIDKYSDDVLNKVFTPDEMVKLKDIKQMSNAIGKGTKLVEGSPTAEKIGWAVNGLLGLTNLPVLFTKFGLEYGMSKLFTSNLGRKLITGGKLQNLGGKTSEVVSEVGNMSKTLKKGNFGENKGGSVLRYGEESVTKTEKGGLLKKNEKTGSTLKKNKLIK